MREKIGQFLSTRPPVEIKSAVYKVKRQLCKILNAITEVSHIYFERVIVLNRPFWTFKFVSKFVNRF